MKYRITYVNAKTGAEGVIDVEANNEQSVLTLMKNRGLFTCKIDVIPEVISDDPPQLEPDSYIAPSITPDYLKPHDPHFLLLTGGGLVIALVCCGISSCFSYITSHNANYSPSSTSRSEYTSPYGYSSSSTSRSTDTSPYGYNDSTDSQLKNLPNMRGFSDPDKEKIISEAKKLEAALKETERKRGY